jgi:hypothetical protein
MEKLARVTDASVRRKTGRGWNEWIEALDNAGAAAMPHIDIARLVHERFGVDQWWSQTVTVGYEQAKGRRVEGQKCDGFAASVSRTVAQPIAEVHAAWAAGKWLKRVPGAEITTASAPKSVRIRMPDGTRAAVYLTAKAGGKTAVQVQHEKLAGPEAVEPSKALWREIVALVAGAG